MSLVSDRVWLGAALFAEVIPGGRSYKSVSQHAHLKINWYTKLYCCLRLLNMTNSSSSFANCRQLQICHTWFTVKVKFFLASATRRVTTIYWSFSASARKMLWAPSWCVPAVTGITPWSKLITYRAYLMPGYTCTRTQIGWRWQVSKPLPVFFTLWPLPRSTVLGCQQGGWLKA